MEWVYERFRSDDTNIWDVEKIKTHTFWSAYKISPAAYSFVGVYFLSIALCYGVLYPGHYVDSLLLINQGILSYLGDVYFFDRPHFTRVLDRIMAIALTLRFIIMNFLESDIIQTILFLIYTPGALYCYYKSYKSRKSKSLELYLYWHTIWHLGFPIGLYIWISYLLYIN